MQYVCKLRDRFHTRYGYGATDHEAVSNAVKARLAAGSGVIDMNSAWITVSREMADGAVDRVYGMAYVAYCAETR